MNLKFDLNAANWVSHLTDRETPLPSLDDRKKEKKLVEILSKKLRDGFSFSIKDDSPLRRFADRKLNELDASVQFCLDDKTLSEAIGFMRELLSTRPWIALIFPSGYDTELDAKLCSEDFPREVMKSQLEDSGVILQINDFSSQLFEIINVFPALQPALAQSSAWPGLLIWTSPSNSVFLPFSSTRYDHIRNEAEWIFSELAVSSRDALNSPHVGLKLLEKRFYESFPVARNRSHSIVRMVHLSDLHIGSSESWRLPCVEEFVCTIAKETGDQDKLIPIISGDLIDTPNEDYCASAHSFLKNIADICSRQPILVLGNHDTRKGGVWKEDLSCAKTFPITEVFWEKEYRLGFIGFDSTVSEAWGSAAKGSISDAQLKRIGKQLDSKDISEFSLIGVLHHHPISFKKPDSKSKGFYNKFLEILDDTLEKYLDTFLELEEADKFVEFIEDHRFGAVLHGHKHIPRIDTTEKGKIPIIGCGSSIGKIDIVNRTSCLSINVLSFEPKTKRMTCRLLAERIPGGGLKVARHEIIYIGRCP